MKILGYKRRNIEQILLYLLCCTNLDDGIGLRLNNLHFFCVVLTQMDTLYI